MHNLATGYCETDCGKTNSCSRGPRPSSPSQPFFLVDLWYRVDSVSREVTCVLYLDSKCACNDIWTLTIMLFPATDPPVSTQSYSRSLASCILSGLVGFCLGRYFIPSWEAISVAGSPALGKCGDLLKTGKWSLINDYRSVQPVSPPRERLSESRSAIQLEHSQSIYIRWRP